MNSLKYTETILQLCEQMYVSVCICVHVSHDPTRLDQATLVETGTSNINSDSSNSNNSSNNDRKHQLLIV